MEKILKTLDALKLSSSDAIPGSISSAVLAASDSVKTKKKERISHCQSLTDAVCSNSVQNLNEFPKILESILEILFQLCNDTDADLRLVATDCLHRIVRNFRDNSLHRLQIEVYREIKKNQSPRSLRTALNLFAYLSPQIRSQKCRAFVQSLLPSFAQISRRHEDTLYESLAHPLTEIFKSLGPYVNDNEIKMLCREFTHNLDSTSAIIRRASSTILVAICQHSKKPHIFLPKILSTSIDLLMPNLMEKSVPIIIGVLITIKQSLHSIYELFRSNLIVNAVEEENIVRNVVQVYEMCLILCNHDDHNVITTALETLQELLTHPVEKVILKLTSPSGIQNSLDMDKWSQGIEKDQMGTSVGSLHFVEEAHLLEGDGDVPTFRDLPPPPPSSSSEGEEPESEPGDLEIEMLVSSRRNSEVFLTDLQDPVITGNSSDDESSEQKSSILLQHFPEVQIGSLYDQRIALDYCGRFLASNFLLAGTRGSLRTEMEVRTSVKVLALNCIVGLVQLHPELWELPLPIDESGVECQRISDLALYAHHSDPLLRGTTSLLVGKLIRTILSKDGGSFTQLPPSFQQFIDILQKGLEDSSYIGVKCTLNGIHQCLIPLWRFPGGQGEAKKLFEKVLDISFNQYFLVNVDLIELLASIEWDCVQERVVFQEQVLNLILKFICDEDHRVRGSATASLNKYLKNCGREETWIKPQVLCYDCVLNQASPGEECFCGLPMRSISKHLERVVHRISLIGQSLPDKHSFTGAYTSLSILSNQFPPNVFNGAWGCGSSAQVPILLATCVELLRSSPFVQNDLFIHQSLLTLTRNLLLGSFISDGSGELEKPEKVEPIINPNYYKISAQIFQHCLSILKIYQSVVEPSSGSSKKSSSSTALSPAKKSLPKVEGVEKKLPESDGEKKASGGKSSAHGLPSHYQKILTSVQRQWRVFRGNLEPSSTLKFVSLLSTALDTLGHLCQHFRPDNLGLPSQIEEIIGRIYSVFHLSPVPVLNCIKQMLICLFSFGQDPRPFPQPRSLPSDQIERFELSCENNIDTIVQSRKKNASNKNYTDLSLLGNYIRQFESIVITGLRMYTTCSDVDIQSEVLSLLNQLIKLHVNYGLIDANQVFLGFVIKQVAFLEEGHIRNASRLVEEIFNFLNLLSHEHSSSKKFIDVQKVLRLCDGLVASGQNPITHCIPALRPVVKDLYVTREVSSLSPAERLELETQRQVLLQMLLKLSSVPQILPIHWTLIEGRRTLSDSRWTQDSTTIIAYALPALVRGEMVIVNRNQFSTLIALLYSVNPLVFQLRQIISTLLDASNMEAEEIASFRLYSVIVNSHILILIKLISSDLGKELLQGGLFSARLVLKLLHKSLSSFNKLLPNLVPLSECVDLFIDQTLVFLESITCLLRKGIASEIKKEMAEDGLGEMWTVICGEISKLVRVTSVFQMNLVELASTIQYRESSLWEILIGESQERNFVQMSLVVLLKEINGKGNSELEEWVVERHMEDLLMQIDHPEVSAFFGCLNRSQLEKALDQIQSFLESRTQLSATLSKCLLKFLERTHLNYGARAAILSLKLLLRTPAPFVCFEVANFSCLFLNQIRDAESVSKLNETEVGILVDFSNNPLVESRFPRTLSIIKNILNYTEFGNPEKKCLNDPTSPISKWCTEDVNGVEGMALAKMLDGLSYSQVLETMGQPTFNFSLLEHSFRYLIQCFYLDTLNGGEIIDLLTSEKRPSLIKKTPLGVAILDFIVDTLDSWEGILSKAPESLHELKPAEFETFVGGVSFLGRLSAMWRGLSQLYCLKRAMVASNLEAASTCSNNFIPTKLFIFSFLYVGKDVPLPLLFDFLNFASTAVSDSSFFTFFNTKDNSGAIAASVLALGQILRRIVTTFRLDYAFNPAVLSESCIKDIPETLGVVLFEFHHLTEFVFRARRGDFPLDSKTVESLAEVVGGLGRCEVLNMWVLLSHCDWRPNILESGSPFPRVNQIPAEILQNDRVALLQYARKLNLVGVSSKTQFEENWMTFLSVINSYGDEHAQINIISTGLRGLSMLLERTVHVKHIPKDKDKIKRQRSLMALRGFQLDICGSVHFPTLLSDCDKQIVNEYGVDVGSCLQFLIDLFSQWLGYQQKIPSLLLSEIIHTLVIISNYFDEEGQYHWMYTTLVDLYNGMEKEEIFCPQLVFGIFFSAAQLKLEPEGETPLILILESSLSSQFCSMRAVAIRAGSVYLQHQPNSPQILSLLAPHLLKNVQLTQTLNDSERLTCDVWSLLLFLWCFSPPQALPPSFEEDTLGSVLTVLSPVNKVAVSLRVLVLRALQTKYALEEDSGSKRKLSRLALEIMQAGQSVAVFFEALKLFLTIFYLDFAEFNGEDPHPEALMQMAERLEVLFKLMKKGMRCHKRIVSKVLPILLEDFFPPSEILNRVIAEFLSPQQTNPELLAPAVAQVFEKARKRSKDGSLVREWVVAGLSNFFSSPDADRVASSLVLFFAGISPAPQVALLLPFAQLRRRPAQTRALLIFSAIDFYSTLNEEQRIEFLRLVSSGPFHFLLNEIQKRSNVNHSPTP